MPADSALTLVTGGAGLIGHHVLRQLAARGHRLAVAEELGTDQRYRNLSGIAISEFLSPDELLAGVAGQRALPRFGALVHLGACSSTTEPDASYLMRNNFGFSRALARWSLDHGVRFIYASSAATYGDGALGYGDDPALLPRLQPLNKYAYSKHAFDLWALEQGAFTGPGAVAGLKYFNVYGPGEQHKGDMRSMVLKAYEQIQSSGRVALFRSYRPEFEDGEQRRDFLYVDDAAAVTVWFVEHPEAAGVFNVGSGVERSWKDLARGVFAALGRNAEIDYIPMPPALRAAYQYSTRADLSRLRGAGCGLSFRSLEDGIDDYVRHHLLPAAVPERPEA